MKKNKKLSGFLKSRNEGVFKKISHYIPLIGLILCSILYFKFKVPFFDSTLIYGGILPLFIIFNIVYFFIYLYLDIDDLTDNVKANRVFSPFVFILVLITAVVKFKMPLFNHDSRYFGGIGFSLIFILNYLYSSSYFQPDLDTSGARPGMTHFPVGKWIAASRYGQFVKWFFKPITVFWFKLWGPFATMFTHRGITHFPIIGAYLRVSYLWLFFSLLNYGLSWVIRSAVFMKISIVAQIALAVKINFVHYGLYFCEIFYPWNVNFGSMNWILICCPIFLGDFVHILVDFIDSYKRDKPFCHPQIPRGLIFQLFKEILKIFRNI